MRRNACKNLECATSTCIARLAMQVNKVPYLFTSLLPSLTYQGPKQSTAQYENGGAGSTREFGRFAIFCCVKAASFLQKGFPFFITLTTFPRTFRLGLKCFQGLQFCIKGVSLYKLKDFYFCLF